MISIILPTRNRLKLFTESVESLLSTVSSVDNIEILVAMDDDDFETVSEIQKFIENKPYIKLFLFTRKYYHGLHEYVNFLANKASGKFIMTWNDDCLMETKDWDKYIMEYDNQFIMLSPKVKNMEHYWKHQGVLFPIIPKKWVDIIGIISPVHAFDSWIDVLSKRLKIFVNLETVVLSHNRFDLIGEAGDSTYNERSNSIATECNRVDYSILWEEHYQILKKYLDTNYANS